MVSWTRVVAVKNYLILDIFWKENQHYCFSVAESCPTLATPCTEERQAPLSSTISWNLLRFMSIESVMLSNHLILCHLLLLLPSIFPSNRVISNESALRIKWPKYWSFSNSLPNEYSGSISFKTDVFSHELDKGNLCKWAKMRTQKLQQEFWPEQLKECCHWSRWGRIWMTVVLRENWKFSFKQVKLKKTIRLLSRDNK